MILPKRLRAWHVLLSLFSEEIAKELGEIILRLSVAIGPIKHGVLKGKEDPDGFEGLTSKGDIHHLIPSEWLLADEIPHEFDRRAAMGEQLFFKKNQIEHKKGLVSVLLFDSGPMQLGSPKIAHLALLILFARRAEATGASFYWGVIQKDSWKTDVTKASINYLLKSSSPHDVSSDMIDIWKTKTEELGEISDFYLVGEEYLKNSFLNSGTIIINDLESDEKLDIKLFKKSNSKHRLTINLPMETDSIKILRDPFDSDMASQNRDNRIVKHRIIPLKPPVFSRNNRKIAISIENKHSKNKKSCGVLILSIPNSAAGQDKGQHGRPRYFFPYENDIIAGLQIFKKRCSYITNRDDIITLTNFFEPDHIEIKSNELNPPLESDPFWTVINKDNNDNTNKIYILDTKKNLYKIEDSKCELVESEVILAHHIHSFIIYAIKSDDEVEIRKIPGKESSKYKIDSHDKGKTFISEHGWSLESKGLMAINTKGSLWTINNGHDEKNLVNAPDSSEVIGISMFYGDFLNDKGEYKPYIVVLEKDKKTLSIISKDDYFEVYNSVDEIGQISMDIVYGNVAFVTLNGSLNIYSILRKEMLLNISGEES